MVSKSFTNRIWLFISLMVFSLTTSFAQTDVKAGKTLFRDNCAACHNKDMKTKLVGPGLAGAEERWKDYPKEDLYSWIRNADKLIKSGHKKANEVFEANNKMPMLAFDKLTDDDITAILAYVNDVASGGKGAAPKPGKSESSATAGAADAGKTLFRNNCAACHNKDMKTDMTGPALGGVQERWGDYPIEDLRAWIHNSNSLIESGHKRANEIWKKWQPVQMTPFPNLSDEDIDNILAYISNPVDKTKAAGPKVDNPKGNGEDGNSTWLYLGIAGLLLFVSLIMSNIIGLLRYATAVKAGATNVSAPKSILATIFNKGTLKVFFFLLFLFGGYQMVRTAVLLSSQRGYQPTQPINFSHKIHAGDQQIDCKFCHDGARRSRHSVIPSTNTCMLCHKAITSGSKDGTKELTKIYASIGFDPSTGTYIDNYDQLSEEDVEKIYSKWIMSKAIDGGASETEAARIVAKQWKGIKDALTNPENGDDKIQGPIEWVKVHNLPDHVYYNHSQHVTVGKLECQTCHGPVEEMDVIEQYAPLTMGWCVNCHRKTDVQFDNEYYKSYELLHKEMKSGARSSVKVEDIGGTECQKCHY